MKTLMKYWIPVFKGKTDPFLLLLLLILLYPISGWWIRQNDQTVALPDAGIWQLLFLSLISFIGVLILSAWLLNQYWQSAGLPEVADLVSKFKTLTLWQQLGFYWASFALVLLAAVGCLVAVM